ncbi:MAG TPA: universal stress protein [Propionibacteriaceae bacterium]
MTVVVGYIPHKGGRGALDLGLQLAYALAEPLTVVTVVPRQWSTPSLAKVDAEYVEYARQVGEQAAEQGAAYLADSSVDVPTTFRAVTGRSVSSTLIEVSELMGASMLVLGSSADGEEGRIDVGATADKLLHSSPVPLAIAPRGYRSLASDGVGRVTCAFSDSESSRRVVRRVVELTERFGVALRIASFGVRGSTMYPPAVGLSAEDSVLDSWVSQAGAAQEELVSDGVIGPDVERVTATGSGWSESVGSIDWLPTELLTLGSSTVGPLARVFLGSRATKLVRHSQVPVVVIPSEREA